MKPEPKEATFCSKALPSFFLNCSNISGNPSKGDPGGRLNWNSSKGAGMPSIVCVVEIFTTAGISFSTSGAKLSGNGLLEAELRAEQIKMLVIKNTEMDRVMAVQNVFMSYNLSLSVLSNKRD
jgi:hypothetical protein